MAYSDYDATSARGLYSPPDGSEPVVIPDIYKTESGTRTDLPDLSDDELTALGWKGPFQPPTVTEQIQEEWTWNTETRVYDKTPYDDEKKAKLCHYELFWSMLIESPAYTKIKSEASSTLAVNVLATEFIAHITDAKAGAVRMGKIQASITDLLGAISFSTDELADLQRIFSMSGMIAAYSLE